ncbi:hypothetical protein [Acetobacter sp. DsW_063]|uniref:hypothetical protein n=1 Tax=Acetobacter sp. DsW_063 TaxID=1514894 RepID=UPI000B654850|nr:hypothetical protein [Acetobacter sp. DsW_063]OUJ14347.1 hypothetical protein HK28_13920 [Acetobacter sp. DsW_063]
MPAQEQIIFQTYTRRAQGRRSVLQANVPIVCPSEGDGLRRLEKVREGALSVDGAQVVRVAIDDEAGDYGEPVYLGSFGDVPGEAE